MSIDPFTAAPPDPYDDPYRPLPPVQASATGTEDRRATELAEAEEPVTTGTLFLNLILLMIIFGFWVLLYSTLLDR